MNEEPRILIYDIENSQTLVKGWGPMHDFSVTSIVEDFYILSYAHKWHGEPNTAIRFERKAARRGDDKTLMRKLWKLYDQADAVMAYNGDSFDQKKAWTRMSYHDLGPCSPYIELDPLKMMRQKFKLTSNKLDFVAKYYGIGANCHTKDCIRGMVAKTTIPKRGKSWNATTNMMLHCWMACMNASHLTCGHG